MVLKQIGRCTPTCTQFCIGILFNPSYPQGKQITAKTKLEQFAGAIKRYSALLTERVGEGVGVKFSNVQM